MALTPGTVARQAVRMRAGVASSFGEAQLLFLIGLGFPLTVSTSGPTTGRCQRALAAADAIQASALTHSADSRRACNLRVCAHGTDSMRVVERIGPNAA
jgi:hypothetical protein